MEKGRATDAPPFLCTNVHHETIMGSHAYEVADTSVKLSMPDYDVYGFAIPPKEMVFKHLTGSVAGFGPKPIGFEQWQKHYIHETGAGPGSKEWDMQILSIVKFFELCRQNNPTMLDSLFTSENCVLHCTLIGRRVRDQRHLFVSKLYWKKFRGYALAESAYVSYKLPETQPLEPIRVLLNQCLEEHYGSLDGCFAKIGWAENALRDIDTILHRYRGNLYS